MIYTTKNAYNEKLKTCDDDSEKEKYNSKIENLDEISKWFESNTTASKDEIKSKIDEVQAIAADLYASSSPAPDVD